MIPALSPAIRMAVSPSQFLHKSFETFLCHFPVIRHLTATTMGAKELVYNRPKSPQLPRKKIEHVRSIRDPITWVVKTIWLSRKYTREFYTVHGALFMTSGAAGLWGLYFQQKAAIAISEGAFVLANLVALKYHITLYLHSTQSADKNSAVLGILSNLGYIISHAMLMIGFHATIAFVICCLALSMGGLKIFYDFLRGQGV